MGSLGALRARGGPALLAVLLVLCLPARAETGSVVKIVTSFPASFYEPFRLAFEAGHPQYRLRVLNRKTSSAVATVSEPRGEAADLIWASAPDAFEVVAAQGRLRASDRPLPLPLATVGAYPIDHPGRLYLGFAISGYGLVVNEPYLARAGLPVPRRLEDLRDPLYRGHVGISSPSRSGTMHLMVEGVLQRRGWEEGWAVWMEIGGNLSTITARSFGVIDGVTRSRFGIGLSVDFLGRTVEEEGGARFVYPADSVFLPASVGLLEQAPNPAGAQAFIDFLMSGEGQALLLDPAILRLPIDPALYGAGDGLHNPFAAAAGGDGFVFDSELSSTRYELVNLLFDEIITFRLYDLRRAWQAIHRGEALLAGHPDPRAETLLQEARLLAGAVPVTALEAADPAFIEGLYRRPRGVPVSERQAGLEALWRERVETDLREALRLAEEAADLLSAGPVAVR